MIDAQNTGAIGYSFDGYNTLTMSGARIDPELYLAQCPTPSEAIKPIVESGLSAFNCYPAEHWDEFVTQAGEAITGSEDGLWQPITDERIRAVMPLAGEGWWLFGERGLASVDRPVLNLMGTADELYPENALIYEHLGTPEKAFISFIGHDHMMVRDPEVIPRLAHFIAAFFGYHLQGRPELAEFYSKDFVAQHEDLAWGVVEHTGDPDFPLSNPGPYNVGYREISYFDETRNGRQVPVTVWYPTLQETGIIGNAVIQDAAADLSGVPYPLIVSSTKFAEIFAPYLVSHGFTWASVDGIDSYMLMNEQMYEQPLDLLFALDQVASNPPPGLESVIDAEHTGAIGYSFDGYNTLAMSGARIDPELYLAQCPTPSEAMRPIVESGVSAFNCFPAEHWDEFVAQAGEAITASQDGLWQPITDERIRAVMPLAGEGWWLFGEQGLAAVDRPVLNLMGTADELYPENALIYEHLGTPDKAFISFIGHDHMMVIDPEVIPRLAHFIAAFFGYHLQGHPELAEFYSKDFVAQLDDLAWGVVADD